MKLQSEADFREHKQNNKLFGVYKGVSNDDYHSLDGYTSRSDLELLKGKSPIHYRYKKLNPDPTTDAMKMGQWVHTMVLEPDAMQTVFYNETDIMRKVFAAKPDTKSPRSTKIYKQIKAEKISQGYEVIKSSEVEMLMNVERAVRERPMFQALVNEGVPELSFFAEINGVKCRAKADWTSLKRLFVIDLKTCQDANPEAFVKEINDRGYHRQAAFYLDVISTAIGKPMRGYGIIAVEKNPPYAVSFINVHPAFIERGREQYQKQLKILRRCYDTGVWPSYPDKFLTPMPHPWMLYDNDDPEFND